MSENNINKLAEALNKAQASMGSAKQNKSNPFFKSKYSDLSSVFEAIREPFASNGLSVCQTMRVLDNGRTLLRTRLMHLSGQYLDSEMLLPDIVDPQKFGSSISYYKRFALMAIAGVSSSDEDDDGNEASKATKSIKQKPFDPSLDDATWDNLNEFLNGHQDLRIKLMQLFKVNDLRNIKKSQLEAVRKYSENYLAKQKEEVTA